MRRDTPAMILKLSYLQSVYQKKMLSGYKFMALEVPAAVKP